MIHVVLYQPEIPPNTGNVIRLASNTGCTLHLIRPLGFDLEDKQLRRAGLDYHEYASMQVHDNWDIFVQNCRPERLFALSTKGQQAPHEVAFAQGDFVLFGPESRGLPEALLAAPQVTSVLRLPMLPHSRSLNLSNAVAVVVYEAWRQLGFTGSGPG